MKVGGRLLRRVMGMYKDDAVDASVSVLAEELSQRLYDADGELRGVEEGGVGERGGTVVLGLGLSTCSPFHFVPARLL